MVASHSNHAEAEVNPVGNGVNTGPSLPPKRPFLRKGTQREPSALHAMNGIANSRSVSPATEGRSNTGSSGGHVDHVPGIQWPLNAGGGTPPESPLD